MLFSGLTQVVIAWDFAVLFFNAFIYLFFVTIISFHLNFQFFRFYKEYTEFTIQSDILDLRWTVSLMCGKSVELIDCFHDLAFL